MTVFHPELAAETDDGLVTFMAFKLTDEAFGHVGAMLRPHEAQLNGSLRH